MEKTSKTTIETGDDSVGESGRGTSSRHSETSPSVRIISAKVISHKNLASLIEWTVDGEVFRCTVPIELVPEDGVIFETTQEFLEEGIPYGADWKNAFDGFCLDSARVERLFKQRGIWTVQNAEDNLMEVLNAIREILAIQTSTILQNLHGGIK
jgi:hypothetical protein